MNNTRRMSNEQTFTFLISLLLFSSEFYLCFAHLKDLGEKDMDLKDLLEGFQAGILNGEQTKLEDFPFAVQFFNHGGLCSGSILTRKTVLTAAHCFDFNTNLGEMKVISSALYKFDRKASTHEVWDFTIHKSYNYPYRYSNDIAMIIIRGLFVFRSTVQKVVLVNSTRWMTEKETNFVVSGWGLTEWRRNMLMKTTLRYVSPQNCSRMSGLTLSEDMFCLYGDQKTDTCFGDSGSGVLWKNLLVGIVSHGRGCMDSPSAYVNIYYFKDWIQTNVNLLYTRYCHFHSVLSKYTIS